MDRPSNGVLLLTAVLEKDGFVLEGAGGLVIDNCPSCPTDEIMLFAFTFVGTGGSPFVTGNLTWSATAVGGSDPGWIYDSGDIPVCPTSSGAQLLSLRQIVFWCEASVWKMAIVVVFGTLQDTFQTDGGSLIAMTLTNPESPRTYYTRTPGDTGINTCDDSGYLQVDVRVKA
jgi:hypothetical protein